ncbi:glycosyltransferase family 2 protein [Candidatus Woesearchaeota archaeon]|jgi:glycosyltransferase involved in cell wall biosynthesis|nr:glycosyltransferase family 2 protein [Candidatus Woesearchaeota archaeon]MBT6735126.1 glycosyltransferase family 2 protein [Candidatus Woesearchaeota archaeon]
MTKILIILPAYNEGKIITKVINQIKKVGFQDILIIDDGSTDETVKSAKKAGARVLGHIINRGAGAATSTGLTYAKINNYDYAIFMDSDGQHNPKDIKKLLNYADKYDVVIGSRMIGNLENMPIQRRIANFIGSLITKLFFGLFVRDSQSGFKIFNKNAIRKINVTFDRYEFCSEIIGEIHNKKLSFKEVPIEVIYSTHSLEKKHSGQSIKNGIKMIIKFILRR